MTPKYRPDIDGLRAVAVLSVIAYHAGNTLLTGGFVGVDIFFVISGFLITTIIAREIEAGTFSIARFYERRFRRILPALIVVMAATLVAGAVLLGPTTLMDLGKSAVATALFSSNILFFLQSGYFDGPAELKPLLHTWSLAIEEQYYIFFPLLLLAISRWNSGRYFRWLLTLGALSFAACVLVTRHDPSAAFYLIPTRAWELFMGSLLALRVVPAIKQQPAREVVALAGALLIGYAVVRFSPKTAFPGAAAAIPTLGAALIIHAGIGGQSVVAWLLSRRPVVFIGLISYSLYLWHWPVLVYTRLYSITPPAPRVIAVMLALVFALSVLTWKYVETPFREKRLLARQRGIFAASATAVVGMLACGVLLIGMHGLPQRFTTSSAEAVATADPEWDHWTACEKRTDGAFKPGSLCDIGRKDGPLSFLLWGDSHAKSLASGADLSAKLHGVRGKFASRAACPPLLGIERPSRRSCDRFNRDILKALAENPRIGTVLLVARWSLAATGVRYKQETGEDIRLVDLQSPRSTLSNAALLELGLGRTVSALRAMGKDVVIVRPIPEVGYDVPSYFFTARISGRDLNALIAPRASEYQARSSAADAAFLDVGRRPGVSFVDPAPYLCSRIACKVIIRDVPLYRDDNHLSTFGSKLIAPAFDATFGQTLASGTSRTASIVGPEN